MIARIIDSLLTELDVSRGLYGRSSDEVQETEPRELAAMISNVYYPSADRSAMGVLTRWEIQMTWQALATLAMLGLSLPASASLGG